VFKGASHAGFSSSVKEPLGQKPSRVSTLSEVNNHRPISLCIFLSAKPSDLGNGGVILLAKDRYGFGSNLTLLIQSRGPVHTVDFDRVKFVTKHRGSRPDSGLRHFFDQLVLGFIPAGNSDPVCVFGSTVTARQRQCMRFSIILISVSTAVRIEPADILSFPLSIVQYNVSVKVVGVVFDDERVRTLLG
jgi:hypothetical protein